jgi:hypothetical protein
LDDFVVDKNVEEDPRADELEALDEIIGDGPRVTPDFNCRRPFPVGMDCSGSMYPCHPHPSGHATS